jgi:hypothetical protein
VDVGEADGAVGGERAEKGRLQPPLGEALARVAPRVVEVVLRVVQLVEESVQVRLGAEAGGSDREDARRIGLQRRAEPRGPGPERVTAAAMLASISARWSATTTVESGSTVP